jgi:hypothetical protein
MRFRPFAAFIAALSMMHFTLVTGEIACAITSPVSADQVTHETGRGDCEHLAMESTAVPDTPHDASGHHSPVHRALCCAALAGCAAVLAFAENAPAVAETMLSTRIVRADSGGVPTPHFPPDPPPPKA